jgi:GAF domain-containing protein
MARPDVGRGLALHTREPLSAALGKTQQLETLNRLSLVLTSTLDQAKVFEAVVRTATELFGDVASSLWVVNREGTELTLVADAGLRHPESRARRTLRVGEGLVGRLAQERRPVLLDDVQQDLTRVNSAMAKAEGFHAAASVPLLFGDRCFGALIVRRRTYEVFRPEDVDLLITLGNHAAFAIENGRLHEARELRASRLRTLAELNRIISSSLNADDVLRRIAEAAADLTECPVVAFWIADETAQVLRLSVCLDAGVAGDQPRTTVRYGQGSPGWVALHRRALDVPDVYSDDRVLAPEWFKALGLTSGLWLPIVFRDELLGVLSLLGRKPFRLEPDETELLDSFVGQAAVAIRNAHLFAASERRRDTAEALAEIGRALAESLDRDAVAQRIVETVRALFKSKTAVVFELDPDSENLTLVASAGPALGWNRIIPRGMATVGRAALERRPIVTADVLADLDVNLTPAVRAGIEQAGYRAALAVPPAAQGAGDRSAGGHRRRRPPLRSRRDSATPDLCRSGGGRH